MSSVVDSSARVRRQGVDPAANESNLTGLLHRPLRPRIGVMRMSEARRTRLVTVIASAD